MAESSSSPLKQPTKIYKIKRKVQSCPDIALLPGECVAVADPGASAVKVFDEDGHFQKILQNKTNPIGITATRSGLVVFTQKGQRSYSVRLRMLDGQDVGTWGKDYLWKPHAIAVTNRGRLVLTDTQKHQLQVSLYTQDGTMLYKCHTKSCTPALHSPHYVDVDVYDRIAVSDCHTDCVHVFDKEGKFLFTMGSTGKEDGCLRCPKGVTTDAQGNFLICDTANRRISVFSSSGRFIHHLLTADDGLKYPVAIDYNRSGRLVVANYHSPTGNFSKLRAYEVV